MTEKKRDPLLDSPEGLKVYSEALQGFVYALCAGLRAEDARLLTRSVRAHDGLIVFSDRSGGIGFEVQVTFRDLMNYPETMALVGALTEKNGPNRSPVMFAGDPKASAEMMAEIEKKVRP